MLYRVLDEAVRMPTGNGPAHSGWQDDVRTRLVEVIMNGAANGVKDPLPFARMALTAIPSG